MRRLLARHGTTHLAVIETDRHGQPAAAHVFTSTQPDRAYRPRLVTQQELNDRLALWLLCRREGEWFASADILATARVDAARPRAGGGLVPTPSYGRATV